MLRPEMRICIYLASQAIVAMASGFKVEGVILKVHKQYGELRCNYKKLNWGPELPLKHKIPERYGEAAIHYAGFCGEVSFFGGVNSPSFSDYRPSDSFMYQHATESVSKLTGKPIPVVEQEVINHCTTIISSNRSRIIALAEIFFRENRNLRKIRETGMGTFKYAITKPAFSKAR